MRCLEFRRDGGGGLLVVDARVAEQRGVRGARGSLHVHVDASFELEHRHGEARAFLCTSEAQKLGRVSATSSLPHPPLEEHDPIGAHLVGWIRSERHIGGAVVATRLETPHTVCEPGVEPRRTLGAHCHSTKAGSALAPYPIKRPAEVTLELRVAALREEWPPDHVEGEELLLRRQRKRREPRHQKLEPLASARSVETARHPIAQQLGIDVFIPERFEHERLQRV